MRAYNGNPELAVELQGFIAQINALHEHSSCHSDSLQEQLHRRELDLISVYIAEHPDVEVPDELRDKLKAIPASVERLKVITDILEKMRMEEGIAPTYAGPRLRTDEGSASQ